MHVPAVGDIAADFELTTDQDRPFRLSAQRGKPVVLFFYPEDETEGCTIENIEFSVLASKFARLGVTLVGVSPDSVKKHCKFRDKHKLRIKLVADPDRTAILAYGVWGPKKTFGHEYVGVIRTTFLIDASGHIANAWEVKRIKGHAAAVLEAARALSGSHP